MAKLRIIGGPRDGWHFELSDVFRCENFVALHREAPEERRVYRDVYKLETIIDAAGNREQVLCYFDANYYHRSEFVSLTDTATPSPAP
jgi:hypothetical protein